MAQDQSQSQPMLQGEPKLPELTITEQTTNQRFFATLKMPAKIHFINICQRWQN